MKTRHKRLVLVAAGLGALGLAAWLVLSAFKQNMVFFFTPTQVLTGEAPKGRSFRIGGMVENGSLKRQTDGVTVSFIVTDTAQKLPVTYKGILPDLFKEGKGVVAQGKLDQNGNFVADEVLAKHDENYMPPDAAYAMKKGQEAKQKAAAGNMAKDAK
ncbi:MAG TPA: cytochrome c maturation protein CcmE [Noviherbaspirillum sp.]|uniref:cytochrome c maturation protein CcmE n=1 Tax=Noviherbaspirillum sp. TaxID=1926288 RepID=UPI002B47A983|nr:cytochrome c maturation protein CcmE [Noviherbaspirillum sp.]HJV88631.1 cytochrome c maturation protein CcmE [Noviherbaspirillum sp.]